MRSGRVRSRLDKRKAWRCLLLNASAWWLSATCAVAWAATSQVLLVLSESSPIYSQVASAFSQSLGGKHPLQTRLLIDMQQSDWASARSSSVLVVAVGGPAVRAMPETERQGAMISLMVSRAGLGASLKDPKRHSAVVFDPPPDRYFAFARRLLPSAKRIGVIVSANSESAKGYSAEAVRAGLTLLTEQVRVQEDVPKALQELLPKVDGLLLAPDPVVVNERTARLILMASYRHKVPVIGYSKGLARAGAVGALIAGPEEIGRLGGLLARQWSPDGDALPAVRYAERFQVDFNRQVARSLGVAIPDEKDLGITPAGF
jgi:ABC-type uncharacterized transport system substrate-binding protein